MFNYIKNKKYLVIVNNELVIGFDTKKAAQLFVKEQLDMNIFHKNDKIEITKRENYPVENDGWS